MLRYMHNVVPTRIILGRASKPSRPLPRQSSLPSLFINHYPTDFQTAKFTGTSINFKYIDPKEREPCPLPPPPPPPPPKDDKLFWGTLTVIFITGGFVIYAKTKPEVRDWLTINAPWVDDLIAIVHQENMTYRELANACIEDTKRYLEKLKNGDNKPKECSSDGRPVQDGPEEPECVEEVQPQPEVCVEPPPPVERKSLAEMEKCLIELSDCAIKNYKTARDACKRFNSLVQDTMTTFTYKAMKEIKHAMEERTKLVEESLRNACKCVEKVDEMFRYIDCGRPEPVEEIKKTKALYEDYKKRIEAIFEAYQRENDTTLAFERQYQIVDEIVSRYAWENEQVYAGLNYSSDKPLHVTGDLDALFISTYKYMQHFEPQLKEACAAVNERIDRSLADVWRTGAIKRFRTPRGVISIMQPITTISSLFHLQERGGAAFRTVYDAKAKEKRIGIQNSFHKREKDQKERNNRFLEETLKKQNDAYEAMLATKLEQIEEQVMTKFNKLVAEQVDAEKKQLDDELKEMAMKLKVVEDKLEERLKAERETRRSQELWAAGASLLAATKKADPYVKVDKELKAIEKASVEDDLLVLTVLKSIPESVREKGVVPESVLRDRFRTMERTARSVALVEQEGAKMPVYVLSWLQGLLLFMKISGIPQKEFEKPPIEVDEELDTFDLLQRARFWVDRGNLAIAVRYVDSLKGASRAAALSWFEAARAHLEVRQAAEAVLAHAAALGLRYI